MVDEVALVCIGVVIGALVPFLAGWVTFDRKMHELMRETHAMRGESEELRKVASDLARALDGLGEVGRASASGRASRRQSDALPVDESVSSVAVERELAGRARVQAIVQPSYFQGR